jgi:hypothetical protein
MGMKRTNSTCVGEGGVTVAIGVATVTVHLLDLHREPVTC